MPQTASLDEIYAKIGKRLVVLMRQQSLPLSFAKGTGTKRKTMPNCTPGKSWSCGYACLPMSKKNCGSPLPGQAKTYAQYLANQATANAPAAPPSPPAGQVVYDLDDLSVVTTNQKELNKSRADLEKRFGKATVEAAEKNVQKILDDPDTNVYIRVGSADTLEKILGDRFKTAHELGSDASVPYLKGNYLDARSRVEAKTMGVDPKTADSDRPIYGYLAGKDMNGTSHADVSDGYGSIAVKLKTDVKDRTTFTAADSFKSGIASEVKNDGPPPPPNAASLVASTRHGYDANNLPAHYPSYYDTTNIHGSQLKQAAKAKNIDDLAAVGAPTGNRYIEAQVHGKVKPSDIAEISFTPKGVGDRPTAAIAQFAKANGVPLLVNGKKLSDDELDTLITPPKDKRSQRLQDLSKALDNDDFDTVMSSALQIHDTAQKVGKTMQPGERDNYLKTLYQEAGYDGLPKVGTSADLDKIHQDGGVLMVRGVGSDDPKDKLKYLRDFQAGEYYTGNGIYGNGTYVGHSGYINSKGKFVHKNDATAAKDAKNAVANVAKHGYMSSSTTNFRMAADKDFNVVTQSQLIKERDDLDAKIKQWATAQRQKLLAGAKVATKADVSSVKRAITKERSQYDPAQVKVSNISKKQVNGITVEEQEWTIPGKSGKPLKITVSKVSGRQGVAGAEYIVRDGQGGLLRDANGKLIKLKQNSKGDPEPHTVQGIFNEVTQRRVLKSKGYASMPKVGDPNDPVVAKRVQQFDDNLTKTKTVLGLDHNGESNLAVIKQYDAVALNRSYEPDTFMNLLNRSKITVQDQPLDWKRAKNTGAA